MTPAVGWDQTTGIGFPKSSSIYLTAILIGVNDNRKNGPVCRMAPAGWTGLSGRGVGYGQCESSLEVSPFKVLSPPETREFP